MGWNSWNHFNSRLNETVVRTTADLLVSTGLAAKGYVYVNMDDTWAGGRDSATGVVYPIAEKFPSGIPALVEYVHSKGLKFGIYTDVGHSTCAKCPGTWGHETIDAQTYAKWQVDFVKSDSCFTEAADPEVQPADGLSCYSKYKVFAAALEATGRPMVHSIKGPCGRKPGTMGGVCSPGNASAISNLRRCAGDARDNWGSMMRILDEAAAVVRYARPGYFADMDIFEIGNGGLTDVEERAVMILWCALKSPLLLGNDLAAMSARTLALVGNAGMLSVSQDPLGIAAHRVVNASGYQVWAGPLSNAATVVVLLNTGNSSADVHASWAELGLPAGVKFAATDLWTGQAKSSLEGSLSAQLGAHAAAAFHLVRA
jgi:alpha-galactosidase